MQYAGSMRALTGMEPLDPPDGGTFVAHHMVFNKFYVLEMLELMVRFTGVTNLPWPLLIMRQSRTYYRFSEYKTYATFMLRMHPEDFHYHPLKLFGQGGLRFREANEVVEDMMEKLSLSNGGLSYHQMTVYFADHWLKLCQESVEKKASKRGGGLPTAKALKKPAYVQLDHVYGLDGVDLNIVETITTISSDSTGLSPVLVLSSNSSSSSLSDNEKCGDAKIISTSSTKLRRQQQAHHSSKRSSKPGSPKFPSLSTRSIDCKSASYLEGDEEAMSDALLPVMLSASSIESGTIKSQTLISTVAGDEFVASVVSSKMNTRTSTYVNVSTTGSNVDGVHCIARTDSTDTSCSSVNVTVAAKLTAVRSSTAPSVTSGFKRSRWVIAK